MKVHKVRQYLTGSLINVFKYITEEPITEEELIEYAISEGEVGDGLDPDYDYEVTDITNQFRELDKKQN